VSFVFGIILFVLAILVIVMVHEGGHFAFAKLFGMKVQEFFVGFGPKLWSFRRGETEYGVKAILAGGYVRIAGMNPFKEEPPEDQGRTFGAKPAWQRAIVIFAGPLTHFLMAFVFFAVYFVALGQPTEAKPVVDAVQAQLNGVPSPAAQAGLRAGDEIVMVDGKPVGSIDAFTSITHTSAGRPLPLEIRRGGRLIDLTATPVLADLDGKQVGRLGIIVAAGRQRYGPIGAIGQAGVGTGRTIVDTAMAFGRIFGPSGLRRVGQLLVGSAPRRTSDVSSIVGVARFAGQAAGSGQWDFLFSILIVINVFVGLVNLVPLPPLDGGHIAVLAYEKVRRRKPDLRKLAPLSTAVAVFLILFSLSLIFIDITNPIPNPFR
jgi:membrane-associated protease RseP (regulator of RpoE activity)